VRRPDTVRSERLIGSSSAFSFSGYDEDEDAFQKAMEESRRIFREEEARRVLRHQQVLEAWEHAELEGIEKRLSWFIRFPPSSSGELDPTVWSRIVTLYHHFRQRFSSAAAAPPSPADDDSIRPEVEQARILLFRVLSSDNNNNTTTNNNNEGGRGGGSNHPQIGRFLTFLDAWSAEIK